MLDIGLGLTSLPVLQRHGGSTPTPTPTPSIGTAVITQTSTAGDNPFLWTTAEDATFFPGYFWNVQTATGASTAAASANLSGGTTSADVIQQILPGDLSGTDPIVFAGLGTTSLSGPLALWERVGKDDGAGGYTWGSWSNILTDTLAATSTAVLATTTGVNKSQYIDVTGTPKLTAAMNNEIGAGCCVRTTTAVTGKRHFEVTINGLSNGINIGVVDASVALGAAVFGPNPGGGSNAGCSLLFDTSTSANFYRNAGSTGASTPALAVNDIIIVEFDTVANTVSFVHRRGATETAIVSVTLTSNIPTSWTAFVGGRGASDSVTVNFGASAFAGTVSSGYNIYG